MLVGPDGRRYPELCSVAPHYLWSRGGPIDLQDLYDRAVEQVLVEIYEQGRYSGDEAAARFVFLLMLAVSDQNHQLRDL